MCAWVLARTHARPHARTHARTQACTCVCMHAGLPSLLSPEMLSSCSYFNAFRLHWLPLQISVLYVCTLSVMLIACDCLPWWHHDKFPVISFSCHLSGPLATSRSKQQGMEFAVWVFKHVSAAQRSIVHWQGKASHGRVAAQRGSMQ